MICADWDIFDWLEYAKLQRWKRCCPEGGSDDVKYAAHDKNTVGCDLSVLCNECKSTEMGDNNTRDIERIVRGWHKKPVPEGLR